MSKNKLSNPEDVEVPPEVSEAAIWGRLTFFVGNGVSRLYGVPSWDELADKMLKKLVEVGKIDYSKYDLLLKQPVKTKVSIADHFFKKDYREGSPLELSYGALLHHKDVSLNKFSAYDLLAEIGCRFLTTNYDTLLSDALSGKHAAKPILPSSVNDLPEVMELNSEQKDVREGKGELRICHSIDEFSESDLINKTVLVHLHGSISNIDSLVASSLDYINLYSDPEKVDKLRQIFEGQTIVFVGYGLAELELLELIVRSTKELEKEGRGSTRFFNLLPLLSHEYETFDLLKIHYEEQLGINLLPYSRDKEDFHSLIRLIESWSGKLSKIVNAPGLEDKMRALNNLLAKYREASNEE